VSGLLFLQPNHSPDSPTTIAHISLVSKSKADDMGYLSSRVQSCTLHISLVPQLDIFLCFIQVQFSQLQRLISVSCTAEALADAPWNKADTGSNGALPSSESEICSRMPVLQDMSPFSGLLDVSWQQFIKWYVRTLDRGGHWLKRS
jgi:hypothetical protein